MNQIWSMDYVADALFDGRRLRALTVVDNYTRESLAIDVGQSLKGDDVVNTLNRIAAYRGLPTTIKVDNGSEFISKVMDKWAYEHGVELDFRRPGKPMTMRRSRALTVDSVRSACTLTGSCPLPMQKPRSRSGGSTILRRVPTLHCSGPHHQNSPVRQGKRPNRAFQRSRKFLLQTGTNSGVRSEANRARRIWNQCGGNDRKRPRPRAYDGVSRAPPRDHTSSIVIRQRASRGAERAGRSAPLVYA